MTSLIPSDIELWQEIKADNRIACETLYRRYMRVLYSAIYKWTENTCDTEDILQDVFLDIWEKRQQINIQKEVFSYLYRITRNKVFDYIKDKKIDARKLEAWKEVTGENIDTPVFTANASQSADELVNKELADMPAQMKEVYLLRYKQEMSIAEIATHLNVSTNTIKSQLHKIRRRLHTAVLRYPLSSLALTLVLQQCYQNIK
jgi:RNA polymerase sigma-70 factor (ECF subfamily)